MTTSTQLDQQTRPVTQNSGATLKTSSDAISGAYVNLEQLLQLRLQPSSNQSLRPQGLSSPLAGMRLSKQKGRGVDFAEVRQYQPGDDVRSIDWRVTARKNTPHTKVFREEREYPALLFVDQSQTMFFGSQQRLKSVASAELAGRLAWRLTGHGDRVGGLVLDNGGHHLFRPARTAKATGRLLLQVARSNQALHRVNPASDKGAALGRLEQALEGLQRLSRQRLRIFIISDLVGWCRVGALPLLDQSLGQLARKHQVILAQISDPLDAALPPTGSYTIRQGAQQLSFFSGDARRRQRYAEDYQQHLRAIEELSHRWAAGLVRLGTDDPQWDLLDIETAAQAHVTRTS